jgi:heme o synthase
MALTKARLSTLVAVTTLFGYWLGRYQQGLGVSWWLLLHTLVGTLLCAFGSSVFNQLMEVDADRKMKRTAGRPLPARKLPTELAFVFGVGLCSLGLIHLDLKVNFEACVLAGFTLISYIFIYTPMKRRSSLNTLVGAVSGAFPPLIGWAAAHGMPAAEDGFRWALMGAPQAVFLFGLLFLWQLPHFVAINWMYREEYERGGFVMWSNGDLTGDLTSKLALLFSGLLTALMLQPQLAGFAGVGHSLGGVALGLWLVGLAWRFRKSRQRPDARRLFLATLLHLPLALGLLIFCARRTP